MHTDSKAPGLTPIQGKARLLDVTGPGSPLLFSSNIDRHRLDLFPGRVRSTWLPEYSLGNQERQGSTVEGTVLDPQGSPAATEQIEIHQGTTDAQDELGQEFGECAAIDHNMELR
jgi:hypothetical protein